MTHRPAKAKMRAAPADEMEAAMVRASRLIEWMAGYIGHMAPLNYHRCYADLNEHFLFVQRNPSIAPETTPFKRRNGKVTK